MSQASHHEVQGAMKGCETFVDIGEAVGFHILSGVVSGVRISRVLVFHMGRAV